MEAGAWLPWRWAHGYHSYHRGRASTLKGIHTNNWEFSIVFQGFLIQPCVSTAKGRAAARETM